MDSDNRLDFLQSVVGTADDIALLDKTFKIVHTEKVLHDKELPDDRIMWIYGTTRRNGMCMKKLPKTLDSANIPYDEDRIIFLDQSTLADHVNKELSILKGLAPPEEKVVIAQPVIETEGVVEEHLATDEVEETLATDEVGETLTTEELIEGVEVEEPTVPTKEVEVGQGNCKYGVPVLAVQYLEPNVLGLQESLFVNVEKEVIDEFFSSIKGKLISNVSKP